MIRADLVEFNAPPRASGQQPPAQRPGRFAAPSAVEQPGNVQVFGYIWMLMFPLRSRSSSTIGPSAFKPFRQRTGIGPPAAAPLPDPAGWFDSPLFRHLVFCQTGEFHVQRVRGQVHSLLGVRYVPDDFPVLADPDRLEHPPVLPRLKHGFIQIQVVGQVNLADHFVVEADPYAESVQRTDTDHFRNHAA